MENMTISEPKKLIPIIPAILFSISVFSFNTTFLWTRVHLVIFLLSFVLIFISILKESNLKTLIFQVTTILLLLWQLTEYFLSRMEGSVTTDLGIIEMVSIIYDKLNFFNLFYFFYTNAIVITIIMLLFYFKNNLLKIKVIWAVVITGSLGFFRFLGENIYLYNKYRDSVNDYVYWEIFMVICLYLFILCYLYFFDAHYKNGEKFNVQFLFDISK